jgi:hypothetical protein
VIIGHGLCIVYLLPVCIPELMMRRLLGVHLLNVNWSIGEDPGSAAASSSGASRPTQCVHVPICPEGRLIAQGKFRDGYDSRNFGVPVEPKPPLN